VKAVAANGFWLVSAIRLLLGSLSAPCVLRKRLLNFLDNLLLAGKKGRGHVRGVRRVRDSFLTLTDYALGLPEKAKKIGVAGCWKHCS
jgi:hypothetical protein